MAAGSRSPMVHLSANPNRRAASKSKLAIVFLCSIVLLGLATQFQLLKVPNYFANSSSTAASNQVPVVVGWGGVGLGENLTNIQTEIQALSQSGYNAVRVDFEPTCTSVSARVLGSYDQAKLGQVIGLAKQYNLWILVDYHGYTELENSTTEQCWLGFWKSLVQNFTLSYSQIIWEPLNEPHMTNNQDVAGLSAGYQLLIDEVRALGDTHWIVVQNLCSSSCGFGDANLAAGYPTVNDTAGHVFISLHGYLGYKYYSSSWNNTTAESHAHQVYAAVLAGSQRTGWPALNTEGGADPQMTNCSKGVSLPSTLCAPDQVLVGSAGYSNVTFHFIQTLTNLYDANSPQKISWIWWVAGSWTDTPGAGIYGALQCDSNPIGWGCLLQHAPVYIQSDNPPSLTAPDSQTVTAGSTITFRVNATDTDFPAVESVALSASSLPAGAVFDPTTGVFSWTPKPNQVGIYYVAFNATDNGPPPDSYAKTVTLHVIANQAGPCSLCTVLSTARLLASSLPPIIWYLAVGIATGVGLSVLAGRSRTRKLS